jgi:hypothetical protein
MGGPERAGIVEFPALHGLTLEQYAGVTAAQAEDFPLDAVLTSEEIDAPTWQLAGLAWKAKIVEAAQAGGALFAAYREKLGIAEDCLRRRISPLDDDLSAWIGFLGAWSVHPAPFEILTAFGLRMNDVARLQRGWSRRVANDASLGEKMAEIAGNKPRAPSAVSAEPARLKPFPWSAKRKPIEASVARTEAEASVEVGGLAVDQYAALAAELAAFPRETERVSAKYGVTRSALPALEQQWKARWAADPALHRDWQRLYAHHQGRLRAAAKEISSGERPLAPAPPAAPELPMAPLAPPIELAGTSLLLEFPQGPALPFVEPRVDRAEVFDVPRPPPSPVSDEMGGTSLELDFGRGPALPFAGEPATMTGTSPAKPESPRPLEALVETGLAIEFPRGPALPFVERAIAAPERAPMEQVPIEPRETLTGTALTLDFPRAPSQLPFEKEAIPAEAEPLAATALDLDFSATKALPFRTDEPVRPKVSVRQRVVVPTQAFPERMSPVIPPVARPSEDLGGTSLELSFPRGPVVPFARPAPPAPPPSTAPPVVQSAAPQAAALTLEQHASLCVELALAPARTAETLARYRLTPGAKVLVDQHFRARMDQDPTARSAWDRAYKTYHEWVTASRKPSR